VLAFVDRLGSLHVVDTDSTEELWVTEAVPGTRQPTWSADGKLLAVLTGDNIVRLFHAGGGLIQALALPSGVASDLSFAPVDRSFAVALFRPATRRSIVVVGDADTVGIRRLFGGGGRLRGLTWSPDGRWLLLAWPAADQLIFVRVADRKVVAVSNVAREFDPGGIGPVAFPRLAGWCCPQGSGLPPG
jgi:WD40 repeat protein